MTDEQFYDGTFLKRLEGDAPSKVVRRRDKGFHVIAQIRYAPGVQPVEYGKAPIECACGWVGRSDDWSAHKLQNNPAKRLDRSGRAR